MVAGMRFDSYSFGAITIDGVTYEHDVVLDHGSVSKRIRLGDYLHRWLEYQRTRGIRSRTLDGYEGYIRREIVPVIGGLELANVRPGHIRAVLAGT
jgi:hypothetical protein